MKISNIAKGVFIGVAIIGGLYAILLALLPFIVGGGLIALIHMGFTGNDNAGANVKTIPYERTYSKDIKVVFLEDLEVREGPKTWVYNYSFSNKKNGSLIVKTIKNYSSIDNTRHDLFYFSGRHANPHDSELEIFLRRTIPRSNIT